jgi:hypothetical protein
MRLPEFLATEFYTGNIVGNKATAQKKSLVVDDVEVLLLFPSLALSLWRKVIEGRATVAFLQRN